MHDDVGDSEERAEGEDPLETSQRGALEGEVVEKHSVEGGAYDQTEGECALANSPEAACGFGGNKVSHPAQPGGCAEVGEEVAKAKGTDEKNWPQGLGLGEKPGQSCGGRPEDAVKDGGHGPKGFATWEGLRDEGGGDLSQHGDLPKGGEDSQLGRGSVNGLEEQGQGGAQGGA